MLATMKLYVMRHGPAEETSPSGRANDRALTPAGRERVQQIAQVLAAADEAPTHILTSPVVRALQTAEIVAAVTQLASRGGHVEARIELEPGGQVRRLVDEIVALQSAQQKKKKLMIVGHDPDLSLLANALVAVAPPIEMQKGTVVSIRFEPGKPPTLRFRLNAKTLEIIKG